MKAEGRVDTSNFSSISSHGKHVSEWAPVFGKTRDAEMIELDPGYKDDKKTGYIPEHDLTERNKPKGWRKWGR